MKVFHNLEDIVYIGGREKKELGEGAFARVNLIQHRATPGVYYAMKELQKRTPRFVELIRKEIFLHRSLSHPNVIAFVDHLETEEKFFIFLEYAKNGDMFEYLRRGRPREEECFRLFLQTCEAIKYIHSNNIMHRDLKPENILLDGRFNVKIADFGWSAIYSPDENRQTLCGTMEYMAPEVFLRKKQTKKTDVWALGVLFYEMFHGHAPFRGNKPEDILRQISQNNIAFKRDIDRGVRELILHILCFDPTKRPTVEEIIAHESIQSYIIRYQGLRSPVNISEENFSTYLKPSSALPLSPKSISFVLRSLKKEENIISTHKINLQIEQKPQKAKSPLNLQPFTAQLEKQKKENVQNPCYNFSPNNILCKSPVSFQKTTRFLSSASDKSNPVLALKSASFANYLFSAQKLQPQSPVRCSPKFVP